MDFKENRAIYLQVADRLSDEILAGKYEEGGRIPATREYAATVEVNVNTVVRSYESLEQAGIIVMKRGLGYFVAEGAAEIIRKSRKETFLQEDVSDFFEKMSQLNIPIEKIVKMYNNYKQKEEKQL